MARRKLFGLGRRERRLLMAAGLAAVALLYHGMEWQLPEPLRQLVGGAAPSVQRESAGLFRSDLQPYVGKVVGVHDGDTLTVLETGGDGNPVKHKIRMAEIDAPELKQPYGQTAKTALSDLVFQKAVQVEPMENDRYGRTVAKVWVGEGQSKIDVNRALVAGGSAWVYRDYLKDRSLLDIETQAKAQKHGLWALQAGQREAPWLYRKKEREGR